MATAVKLVWTGIAMGVVHVLTGPDHISALATLSSSSSSSPDGLPASKWYLFGLGARWGIGHGTGLLLVGGIFVLRDILRHDRDDDDDRDGDGDGDGDGDETRVVIPDGVTTVFQAFVGVFMLLLGLYGIHEAHRNRTHGYELVDDEGSLSGDNGDDEEDDPPSAATGSDRAPIAPLEMDGNNQTDDDDDGGGDSTVGRKKGLSGGRCSSSSPEREPFDDDLEEFRYNIQVMFGTVSTTPAGDASAGEGVPNYQHHHHHHHHSSDDNSPFLALCAGIFHGLAGPGGVLGVVPAIQLHDAGLASCYLLSFCASSTATMGIFASLYGTATASLAGWCASSSSSATGGGPKRTGSGPGDFGTHDDDDNDDDNNDDGMEGATTVAVVEFWIRCGSSSLSVLVGVVWLVLLSMGKLKEVFGE